MKRVLSESLEFAFPVYSVGWDFPSLLFWRRIMIHSTQRLLVLTRERWSKYQQIDFLERAINESAKRLLSLRDQCMKVQRECFSRERNV